MSYSHSLTWVTSPMLPLARANGGRGTAVLGGVSYEVIPETESFAFVEHQVRYLTTNGCVSGCWTHLSKLQLNCTLPARGCPAPLVEAALLAGSCGTKDCAGGGSPFARPSIVATHPSWCALVLKSKCAPSAAIHHGFGYNYSAGLHLDATPLPPTPCTAFLPPLGLFANVCSLKY